MVNAFRGSHFLLLFFYDSHSWIFLNLRNKSFRDRTLNYCDFKGGDNFFFLCFISNETLLRFHYNRTKMIQWKENANNRSDLFTTREDLFQVDCEEVSLIRIVRLVFYYPLQGIEPFRIRQFRSLGYLTGKSTISLHEFVSEANKQINYLHLTIIVTLDRKKWVLASSSSASNDKALVESCRCLSWNADMTMASEIALNWSLLTWINGPGLLPDFNDLRTGRLNILALEDLNNKTPQTFLFPITTIKWEQYCNPCNIRPLSKK